MCVPVWVCLGAHLHLSSRVMHDQILIWPRSFHHLLQEAQLRTSCTAPPSPRHERHGDSAVWTFTDRVAMGNFAGGSAADLPARKNRAQCAQRAAFLSFAFEPTRDTVSHSPAAISTKPKDARQDDSTERESRERGAPSRSRAALCAALIFAGSQMRRCVSKEPLLMPPQLRRPSLK